MNKGISIVVPFYNERDGIQMFCDALDEYQKTINFDLELVFVDDGSIDDTADILKNYHFNNVKYVQLISLSRNFGSHAAISAPPRILLALV